jgi:hypothetical protein
MAASVVSRVGGLGALTAAGQLDHHRRCRFIRAFSTPAYGEYVICSAPTPWSVCSAGLRYDSAIVLPRREAIALSLSLLVG